MGGADRFRMKTTSRSSMARRRRQPENEHRIADISGVLLFALAAITAVALWTSRAGLFGEALGSVFRSLFGLGSWGVVALFALMGAGLWAGKRAGEAAKLGFKTAIVPRRLRKGEPWPAGITVVEARSLREALALSLKEIKPAAEN